MDNRHVSMGLKFDRIRTPDFYKNYIKFNKKQLALLLPKIKNGSLIADYAGGNGILAKDLIRMCKKEKIGITVENIDIDASRFEKFHGLVNIEGDIRKYKRKERYDSAITRHIIHYLSPKEQLKFLENIKNNLKTGGYCLLINFVQDDEKSYWILEEIFRFAEKHKHIIRKDIPTSMKITRLCKKAGFRVVKTQKFPYTLSIADFYRHRFRLSAKQVDDLCKKTGHRHHKNYQFAILMRK